MQAYHEIRLCSRQVRLRDHGILSGYPLDVARPIRLRAAQTPGIAWACTYAALKPETLMVCGSPISQEENPDKRSPPYSMAVSPNCSCLVPTKQQIHRDDI